MIMSVVERLITCVLVNIGGVDGVLRREVIPFRRLWYNIGMLNFGDIDGERCPLSEVN